MSEGGRANERPSSSPLRSRLGEKPPADRPSFFWCRVMCAAQKRERERDPSSLRRKAVSFSSFSPCAFLKAGKGAGGGSVGRAIVTSAAAVAAESGSLIGRCDIGRGGGVTSEGATVAFCHRGRGRGEKGGGVSRSRDGIGWGGREKRGDKGEKKERKGAHFPSIACGEWARGKIGKGG